MVRAREKDQGKDRTGFDKIIGSPITLSKPVRSGFGLGSVGDGRKIETFGLDIV
jgi:hypothetical protein